MANYDMNSFNWRNVRNGDVLYLNGYDEDTYKLLTLIKGTYAFKCYGGAGGDTPTVSTYTSYGGHGGSTSCSNYVVSDSKQIFVSPGYTSFRGGGGSPVLDLSNGVGGGASFIADTNRGDLKDYENYQSEVLMAAGGGGGNCNVANNINGGDGGQVGQDGTPVKSGYAAKGATQTAGGAAGGYSGYTGDDGSFGQGGDSHKYSTQLVNSGAGGGGWYGGGGGGYRNSLFNAKDGCSGGGGGSSWIRSDLSNPVYETGVWESEAGRVEVTCTNIGDYSVTQTYTNCDSDFNLPYLWSGGSATITLTKASGNYTWFNSSVVVTMGGVDVTASVYNPTTHIITITNPTGDIIITATCYAYPVVNLKDILPNIGSYSVKVTADSSSSLYSESEKSSETPFYCDAKPTLNGASSWTYDGSSHGPTIDNPDPAHATKSGTFTATEPGSYSCNWAIGSNTMWADKTYSDVTISWSIEKMDNTCTISPTTATASAGSTVTCTLSATYSGDGYTTNIGTVSGNTVSYTVPSDATSGATYTITVYANAGTYYKQSGSVSCVITVS